MWPNGKALGLGANHRCAADPGEGCVFALILVYSPVFGRVERGKGKLTTVLTTIDYFYRGVAQLVARDIWDVEAASSSLVTPMMDAVYAAGKAAE